MEQPNYWQRLARKRMTRRDLLAAGGVTALGGAAALIVGCGSGGNGGNGNGATRTPRTPGPAGSPTAGGTITIGRSFNVSGIDPHIDLTGLDIDSLIYSYLYGWNPIKETPMFNNLAATFEQPDPEHLEFILILNPGFIIQPNGPGAGEEMTSHDCKASFIRRGTSITAPDKRYPKRIGKDAAAMDAALKTPDLRTLSFTLSRPFVPAIREMANATWAMVPEKVIDKYLSLSQKGFGSGPFMLEEFRGSERVVLKRHPNYVLTPRPWMDQINYIIITENSSLLAAFESGQHDINGAFLRKDDAEELTDRGDFVVTKTPSLFYPVIHMKMKPPFDDLRVRKAIDLALDRDEFIAGLQDGEGNYNGPIQWPQFQWALPQDELRAFYKPNPEQAKQLLADAGYPEGFDAKMKLPKLTGVNIISDTASVIKDQLKRVGINLALDEVELGAFIGSVLLSGNFEMVFFPNLPYDEPDRPLSFYHSLGVTGAGNWTNYNNPELDKLINAQAEEFDFEKRKKIIFDAQRMILNEHGPQLTITGGNGYTAHWNYVHFPFEQGEEPPENVAPFGVDMWTEKS